MSKIKFCGVDASRKHRVSRWLDTKRLVPRFGVEARVANGVWANVADKGELILFDALDDAKRWIRNLPRSRSEEDNG